MIIVIIYSDHSDHSDHDIDDISRLHPITKPSNAMDHSSAEVPNQGRLLFSFGLVYKVKPPR